VHIVTTEAEVAELKARAEAAEGLLEKVSTPPILEVWDDILAMPVCGAVDSKRAVAMMERLLSAVLEQRSKFVLLDVSGIDELDRTTVEHLLEIMRGVELLGVRSALTGIRPAIAQALVAHGVAFGSLVTLGNLKHGVKVCLQWKNRAGRSSATRART
jgi:rsbT co-antagonist protein RsbR